MSAGRTGQAKAMVNNSGLSQIKKNMNKATVYKVIDIKSGKYFLTAGKYEYKVYLWHYSVIS